MRPSKIKRLCRIAEDQLRFLQCSDINSEIHQTDPMQAVQAQKHAGLEITPEEAEEFCELILKLHSFIKNLNG